MLLAAAQILGGHWAVLQTVAWVGMVIENVETESLPTALQKTFSGENPCALCQVVKHGVNEEKKQSSGKTLVKLEAVLAPALQVPPPRVAEWTQALPASPLAVRSLAPPTPPPLA